jgi:hypothetical protein
MRVEAIFGVDGGGQRAAVGGRVGGWRAVLPGLLWAAGAVGLRAPARGANAGWRAVGAAAAGVLWGCGATHVLVPAWSVPRRRDGAEVIGEALHHAARGAGHRVIARRLGRPPGTVRGWLRAARARSELLRDAMRVRAGSGRARARGVKRRSHAELITTPPIGA